MDSEKREGMFHAARFCMNGNGNCDVEGGIDLGQKDIFSVIRKVEKRINVD